MRAGIVIVVTVVIMTASGCGQAHRATLRSPTEAVQILKRQGYTAPTLPGASPGTTVVGFGSTFSIRNGQPIAYLHKGGLYVMVVRGNSHTKQVPGTLWFRSGSTILVGWLSAPSGRSQFNALVEGL